MPRSEPTGVSTNALASANAISVLSSVTAGRQFIAICSFREGGPPSNDITASDTAGNDYSTVIGQTSRDFWQTVAYIVTANSTGTITVSFDKVDTGHFEKMMCLVANYGPDLPTFDQMAFQIGPYYGAPATSGSGFSVVGQTGYFNVAESAVINIVVGYSQNSGQPDPQPAPVCQSFGGDDVEYGRAELNIAGPFGGSDKYRIWLFGRDESAAEAQTSIFEAGTTDAAPTFIAPLSLVFSRALPRDSTNPQYMQRPGSGEEDAVQDPAWLGDPVNDPPTNRPLLASFGREVRAGDIIVAAVGMSNYNPATMTLADPYGNTYDPIPGAEAIIGTNGATVAMKAFISTVEFVPAVGSVFQLIATIADKGSGGVYQASSLSAIAFPAGGPPENVIGAGMASSTGTTDVILTSETLLSVPEGAVLIAFGTANPAGNEGAWNALGAYTLRQSSGFQQFGTQQVNAPRVAPLATETQIAATTDDYNAQLEFVQASGSSGSVILVGLTVPAPPPEQPNTPCSDANITPQPLTDNFFELRRVYATMKPAPRLPIRGS